MTDQAEKAELHCHLDGLLCPTYIKAVQAKGFCSGLDLGKLQRLYPIRNLDEWSRLGEFLAPFVAGNGKLLLEVLRLHLKALAAQNVRYAEIMLCSFLRTADDRLHQLLHEYQNVAADLTGIKVSYLWAIGRSPDRARFEQKIERVISLWRQGYIHGLALAGNEKACKVKDYADIFQRLADEGIPVEIHAGEWCGPDSIWDALEYGYPRRIGHALSLFDDPALPKHFEKNNVHIEFCPTSNLRLSGVRRIEDHPILKAMDCGLSFSINTDDPGHFECTMNSEYRLLHAVRPFDAGTCQHILRNSLSAAFGNLPQGRAQPDAPPDGVSTVAPSPPVS